MSTVSVFVHAMWDRLVFPFDPMQRIGDLKRLALEQARVEADPDAFMVKVRGALVLDESSTLDQAGVVPGGSIITLRRSRTAVR
ncbi:MAG TPA: hypothetical protein VFN22_02410 [Gemmatimonadales bacterium]|nr:hypothetical protein [Gemmatimonadales bacterium]